MGTPLTHPTPAGEDNRTRPPPSERPLIDSRILWLLLLLAAPLTAQEIESDPEITTHTPLRVFLITIDQGDEVWENFGHNAILIRNQATGEAIAWNWGIFDFADVDFIPRFLRGTMRYSMMGMDPDAMPRAYAADNRSIYSNEILLTLEESAALASFVRWNALEENRYYIYDYFRDNCSTRIRDALDLVLGGRLEEIFGEEMTDRTWRWHARRLVQGTLWIDQGLSFLLGTRGDRTITQWEAMFVPMVLMERLEEVVLDRGPLLGPREILFEADRAPTPTEAPTLSLLFPLLGIIGALTFVLLGRSAGRAAKIAFGTLATGWLAFAGALGMILVLVWFTDHVFIHRNVNILLTSPLSILVIPLLLAALTRSERAAGWQGRWAGVGMLIIAVGSLVGVLLQLGVITQGNAEVISVALPVNLGLAVAILRHHREARG